MTATATAQPAPDWRMCPRCRSVVYWEKILRNAGVCQDCGHHFMLSAVERAVQLFDEGSVTLLDVSAPSRDVLDFVDVMPYQDRLDKARRKTGLS